MISATTPDTTEAPPLDAENARLAAFLRGFDLSPQRKGRDADALHRALSGVLLDDVWGEWSDRRIAFALRSAAGVECSHRSVAESRKRLELAGRLSAGLPRVGLDGRRCAVRVHNEPIDDAIDSTLREIVAMVNDPVSFCDGLPPAPPCVHEALDRMIAAWVRWRNAHIARPE
ncbi:MAG TPA: hypothetical protein VGE52_22300 [Pirellulales bacterium]